MNLDKALEIAVKAHSDQKDQVGDPYILHPLRVMIKVKGAEEQMVAVLHDVIEDSPLTLDDLKQAGFPDPVIEAVDGLTHRDGEEYEAYIERVAGNHLATKIKVADLEDNMNFRRIHHLTGKDQDRMARYQKAYRVLTGTEPSAEDTFR